MIDLVAGAAATNLRRDGAGESAFEFADFSGRTGDALGGVRLWPSRVCRQPETGDSGYLKALKHLPPLTARITLQLT